jgi:hypothetical protein
MGRKSIFRIIFVVFAVSVILWGQAWAESRVFVHFLVVPSKAKDGQDINEALAKLRLKLAEIAGGYTDLGPTNGGYLPPGGKLRQSNNYSFIVAAPRIVTADLDAYVCSHFDTREPYVLVWEASSNY